jgi:hypothetical protein
MGRRERNRELARRRKRRVTIKKLREKFSKATTDSVKDGLVNKLFRISPFASITLEE